MSPPTGADPAVIGAAVAADFIVGDLPVEADPLPLLERGADAIASNAPQHSQFARLLYGAAAAVMFPYAVATLARLALKAAGRLHATVYQEIAVLVLKSSISIRATVEEASVENNGYSSAEARVKESTVGAEAPVPAAFAGLEDKETNGGTSERLIRLSQGLTYRVVAPLFYFTFTGIPGLLAYRTLRVLKEQWGGRRGDSLGAAAVRLEQAATFVPARLSALAFAGAAGLTGGDARRALDSGREASAHASHEGWAQGSLAGALDVRLDRERGGPINPKGRKPDAEDLVRAQRLFYVAAGTAVGASLAIVALRHFGRRKKAKRLAAP